MRRSLKKVRDKASRNILIMGPILGSLARLCLTAGVEIVCQIVYEVFEKC